MQVPEGTRVIEVDIVALQEQLVEMFRKDKNKYFCGICKTELHPKNVMIGILFHPDRPNLSSVPDLGRCSKCVRKKHKEEYADITDQVKEKLKIEDSKGKEEEK